MTAKSRNALISIPIVVVIGALIALAGSNGGATIGGIPVFALGVAAAFVIQWLVFIPSFMAQTEKFYDFTGALTYITITIFLVLASPGVDARGLILAAMVVFWALRLGSFLFMRVMKHGKDDRFDEIKPDFPRFLNTWTVQGLWVVLTAALAWVAITSDKKVGLDWFTVVGLIIWAMGITVEIVADLQKSAFKADAKNEGRYISTGLWSKSRHPNYFGEITLWVGVAIIALPVLQGWQWAALISPIFVALLLTKGSGVPLLEAKADKKWGGEADYEDYKKNTPVLIPKLT